MGFASWLESTFGDLDVLCGYYTPRTLLIKDRWLGGTLIVLKLGILAYVLGYQIIVQQQYMALAEVETSVRFQVRAPENAYRWPVEGVMPSATAGMGAPYCLGVTAMGPHPNMQYTIDAAASTYTYTGPGAASPPVSFQQRPCDYLDATAAVPFPETDRVFLTSELRRTNQTLRNSVNGTACTDQASPACDWAPGENNANPDITSRRYIADVEYYTVLIDHNLIALDTTNGASMSRTVAEMTGSMRTASFASVDACAPYRGFPSGCPPFIAVGVSGKPDIVSVATLLEAAGVETLDAPSRAPDSSSSRREGGLVLIIEIVYSNFFYGSDSTGSWDSNNVAYTYSVSAVPATEFKVVTATSFLDVTSREFNDRHGIRILLTTVPRIGNFDLQTLFINATVGLGLLAVAVLIMEFIIFSTCCPLRSVYLQYKQRSTVDMTELRRATAGREDELKSLIARFSEDPYIVDPPPTPIAQLMGERALRKAPRPAPSAPKDDSALEMATLPNPTGAKVRNNPLVGAAQIGSLYDHLPGEVLAMDAGVGSSSSSSSSIPEWGGPRRGNLSPSPQDTAAMAKMTAEATAAAAEARAAAAHSESVAAAERAAHARTLEQEAETRERLRTVLARQDELEASNAALRQQRLRTLSFKDGAGAGNPF